MKDFKETDLIKCKDCGWRGLAKELEADCTDGEAWSNWICPSCHQWLRPEDYILLCPKCDGKGFIEYEHGLIQVECSECKGTGEIDDSGTGQPDKPIGSTNTSKPKKSRKPKTRKGTAKKPH